MLHRAIMVVLLAGLPLASSAFADPNAKAGASDDNTDEVEQACAGARGLEPPKEDLPSKQLTGSVAGCDVDDLYYDAKGNPKSTAADWAKVRACAIAKKDNSILMMLYANGFGVKRNPDLAIKYACGADMVDVEDVEKEAVVTDLLAIKNSRGKHEKIIDKCDYAGVTPTIAYCTISREHQKDRARNRELDAMSSGWKPEQKSAFAALRKAKDDFADARGSNETDMSGTGRDIYATEAAAAEKDLFLKDMAQFEKGALPKYTQQQFSALDRQLNVAYRQAMQAAAKAGPLEVSDEGVKTAQLTWLKYRDAWVAFGRVRYPAVSAPSWEAMLTKRRIEQLAELK